MGPKKSKETTENKKTIENIFGEQNNYKLTKAAKCRLYAHDEILNIINQEKISKNPNELPEEPKFQMLTVQKKQIYLNYIRYWTPIAKELSGNDLYTLCRYLNDKSTQ